MSGDPHVKRWGEDTKREYFMGECDLVLTSNPDFHDGAGIDVHVRTTIQDWFSHLEAVAIRIGEDVVVMDNSGLMLFNQMELTLSDLPFTFGEGDYKYTITYPVPARASQTEEGDMDMATFEGAVRHRLELHDADRSYIEVKTQGSWMGVHVRGHALDFGDSKGLLGEHGTGKMIKRDGTEHVDMNDHGLEWQVGEMDAKLFPELREPQLPHAQCNFPVKDSRRKLRRSGPLFEQAKEACSAPEFIENYDMCVDDVLSAGDLTVLGSW